MKKYSARRVGLGARNLFRSGGGRTEVRAPVGLRRCRSEATVPYRRLAIRNQPLTPIFGVTALSSSSSFWSSSSTGWLGFEDEDQNDDGSGQAQETDWGYSPGLFQG